VKIFISHERSIEEVKQAINRSVDDVFIGGSALPVKLAKERRAWQGDTLVFSVAKIGFMSYAHRRHRPRHRSRRHHRRQPRSPRAPHPRGPSPTSRLLTCKSSPEVTSGNQSVAISPLAVSYLKFVVVEGRGSVRWARQKSKSEIPALKDFGTVIPSCNLIPQKKSS
jgi:hypothetical protein